MSATDARLRRALSWRLDKCKMMRDAGFEPDPHQSQFLLMNDPNVLMLWPRQTGKTRTLAVEVLHTACFDPGDIIILAGEKQDQAFEVFDRALSMHEELSELGELPAFKKSGNEVVFGNSSRVLALPSTVESIRGYTGKLVIIDEAAFAPETVLPAVSPMLLTTNGRLICATTPNGARGWFYEAWQAPGKLWAKSTVSIRDVPRVTEAELERQLGILGPFKYRQEIGLEFIDGAQQYFPTEMVESAFRDDIEPLFPELARAA